VPTPRLALPDRGDSFPSGHTIQAVIALGMLPPVVYALTGRRAVALITTAFTAIGVIGVGISRIVLAAHWPSDVVGGPPGHSTERSPSCEMSGSPG